MSTLERASVLKPLTRGGRRYQLLNGQPPTCPTCALELSRWRGGRSRVVNRET